MMPTNTGNSTATTVEVKSKLAKMKDDFELSLSTFAAHSIHHGGRQRSCFLGSKLSNPDIHLSGYDDVIIIFGALFGYAQIETPL
jgi:hypothetical protein